MEALTTCDMLQLFGGYSVVGAYNEDRHPLAFSAAPDQYNGHHFGDSMLSMHDHSRTTHLRTAAAENATPINSPLARSYSRNTNPAN